MYRGPGTSSWRSNASSIRPNSFNTASVATQCAPRNSCGECAARVDFCARSKVRNTSAEVNYKNRALVLLFCGQTAADRIGANRAFLAGGTNGTCAGEERAMTGQAHWIDLVPILLGAVAIALLLWRDAYTERRFHTEERRLLCPNLRRKVVATLVRSIPTGTVL